MKSPAAGRFASRPVLRTLAPAAVLGLNLTLPIRAATVPSGVATADPERLEALLINGGGAPASNYKSHRMHVRLLVDLLRQAGVPQRRITVLSADGADPAADMARRQPQPEENFWLLEGTRLEPVFRTPITYENSTFPGVSLKPATRAELNRWFRLAGPRLKAGDTLLLYVTDHGTKSSRDVLRNRITLWGQGESVSVRELRALLARLDPGVRVVLLMSQCFSGAFADLAWRDGAEFPSGDVCGYFSTDAGRPAYGCYPEARQGDNVGHSFVFLEELGRAGSLGEAHQRALLHDDTPDAPLRSSDAFLEQLLRQQAEARGKPAAIFADALLQQAWRRPGVWKAELQQLDRVSERFGISRPNFVAEVLQLNQRLERAGEQLKASARSWRIALGAANRANLERFLVRHPAWARQLSKRGLRAAGSAARELAGDLLYEIAQDARREAETEGRLATVHGKAELAKALAHRMEVRLAVGLRLRVLLTSIAANEYLLQAGRPEDRAAHQALLRCESLILPVAPASDGAPQAEEPPFPPLWEDLETARAVLPAGTAEFCGGRPRWWCRIRGMH